MKKERVKELIEDLYISGRDPRKPRVCLAKPSLHLVEEVFDMYAEATGIKVSSKLALLDGGYSSEVKGHAELDMGSYRLTRGHCSTEVGGLEIHKRSVDARIEIALDAARKLLIKRLEQVEAYRTRGHEL